MRLRLRLALAAFCVSALAASSCDDDAIELPQVAYLVQANLAQTSGLVGALQFEINYSGEGGGWSSTEGFVDCYWWVDATLQGCNGRSSSALVCAVVDPAGFPGPAPLVQCEFLAPIDDLTASDFDVRVVDASGPDLAPIDVEVVLDVGLAPGETTTTTDPENPPIEYDVVFAISDQGTLTFESLEFTIAHPGARGSWIQSDNAVDCRWLVEADSSFCTETSGRLLNCIAADEPGFDLDAAILECGFSSSEPSVGTGDFVVRVQAAITPGGGMMDGVDVAVASVTPR